MTDGRLQKSGFALLAEVADLDLNFQKIVEEQNRIRVCYPMNFLFVTEFCCVGGGRACRPPIASLRRHLSLGDGFL